MRFTSLLPIAAAAALVAGAAAAQTPASAGMNDQAPTAVPAAQAAMPASAAIPAGGVASSPTPADEAFRLKAGDPNVISNGPVPDTPANRHLYGGPMSNAGRHTAPAGN